MNFLRSQPRRRPLNQYLASCHAETRIVSWITKPRWQIKIVNITRARLPITNVVYVFRRIHFLLIMNNKQQRVKVIVRYSVSEYVYITGGHILLVKVRKRKTWRRKFTAPPSYLPFLSFSYFSRMRRLFHTDLFVHHLKEFVAISVNSLIFLERWIVRRDTAMSEANDTTAVVRMLRFVSVFRPSENHRVKEFLSRENRVAHPVADH